MSQEPDQNALPFPLEKRAVEVMPPIFLPPCVSLLLLLVLLPVPSRAADLAALCADRAAIERVYYNHRLGTKPPFEKSLPRATLEDLVRQDLNKEAALKKAYGVTITQAQLEGEVQRINTTTHAPETLAEIKAALGNDPERFARALARPILVERELRHRFENDDALHASIRRECEKTRNELLSARTNGASSARLLAMLKRSHSNHVSEATWQLGPPPEEKPDAPAAAEAEIRKRFGPEAQVLSSPEVGSPKDRKAWFADLPAELQNVLRVQLQGAGDISAVIETPGGFLLYLAKEKKPDTLSVAILSLGKSSYEAWVAKWNQN